MSGVRGRCLRAVVFALALQACVLLALLLADGAAVPAGLWLRLGSVVGLCAVAAHLLLQPLRVDLRVLQALSAAGRTGGEPARARTYEAAPLFDSLELLSLRSSELAAIEVEARAAVQDTEKLRASFLAAMAHDLRGPLNAIIGFSDLLVMDGLDAVSAEQRPSVEIIRRSAQDLLVLLNQILEWAKLDAGLVSLACAPLHIESVLYEVASEAAARSADRGLRVEVDVTPDLPLLEADAMRLRQALLGLIDHATRANGAPRVTMRARLHAAGAAGTAGDGSRELNRPLPCIGIELQDPQLLVREADQGSFFEPLRPSYAPSGRRVAGLGLGPALGRALIRAHGGTVWFESRADTGTTFRVELPLSAHEPIPSASAVSARGCA